MLFIDQSTLNQDMAVVSRMIARWMGLERVLPDENLRANEVIGGTQNCSRYAIHQTPGSPALCGA